MEFKPGDIAMVETHDGKSFHVVEIASYNVAGRTFVCFVPCMNGSGRWVRTKRLSHPKLETLNKHFDTWSN